MPKAYRLAPDRLRVDSPKGCIIQAAYEGAESRMRSWEVREGRVMTITEEGTLWERFSLEPKSN